MCGYSLTYLVPVVSFSTPEYIGKRKLTTEAMHLQNPIKHKDGAFCKIIHGFHTLEYALSGMFDIPTRLF